MCGLLSFILYALSLLIGYGDESNYHILVLVKAGLIASSAFFFLFSCKKNSPSHTKESYSNLAFLILLYEFLILLATGRTVFLIKDYPAIINSVVWITSSLLSLIKNRQYFISFWKRAFQNRDTAFLAAISMITSVIVIALSLEPNGVKFTWDSDVIYQYIYSLDYKSIYDAKLLTYNCHVSVIYAQLLVILKLIFGNIRTAYFTLNSLSVICASFGMTFLLKRILPGKRYFDYFLGNALFMFSPWVCGLSTLYIYDYYIWCLFPLLIYFASSENWTGYSVVGSMISFSKAPGLIVFGSVCVGILIKEMLNKKRAGTPLRRIISETASDVKYWFFLSIAIIFCLYTIKSGIEGVFRGNDKSFGIDFAHISQELKLFGLANFMWLYVLLATICIIKILVSSKYRDTGLYSVVIILAISDLFFILFNCVCVTYHLPRYMDSHIPIVILLTAVLILELNNNARYILLPFLCIINMIDAFYSIDLVSKYAFKTINVGDHSIVYYESKETPSLGDSTICNREYYSYQVILDKALTYAINDMGHGDEIMFSLGESGGTWGFSGGRYSYSFANNKHYFELFYDKTIQGLANGYDYNYYDSENMIPFDMHYIFPQETISEITSSNTAPCFYYIYMPTLNSNKESELYSKYDIIEEKDFCFRGWQMNCIKFRIPH